MRLSEVQRRVADSSTVVDKVVEFFAPVTALRRAKARTMLALHGGYEGGRRTRRGTKNWRPAEGSADTDTLPDLPDLRARSRDLVRNVPIATGAVSTKCTNVVGTGLQMQSCIDHEYLGLTEEQADAWERGAEREFAAACRTLDFTSVQDFEEFQYLAFRSADESGDVFGIRRYRKDPGDIYGTKVQLVEADRVSNPSRAADTDKIAGGVELNTNGVPVAYHVTDKHPGGLRIAGMKWERVQAQTGAGKQVVIHLFERLRPDQTRGVPYLAPVIDMIKQLGDYTDSEVRAAVLTSFITWFIKSELPEDPDSSKPILGEVDSSLDRNEIKLGSGAMVDLNPGEDVTAPAPVRPNPQFDPFFLAMTRQIGVALEIPHELLIKHFTASYSASRAALEMAWQSFRRWRLWFARNFCQTIYEWIIEEAVATGRLAAPGYFEDPLVAHAYCKAMWIGPNRASIDPKREAEADKIDVLELRVKTREQVVLERTGGRWEDKNRQLIKEESAIPERRGAAASAATAQADEPYDSGASSDAEDETQAIRGRA